MHAVGGWLQTLPKYQVPLASQALRAEILAAAAEQSELLAVMFAGHGGDSGGSGDVAPGRHGQKWRPGKDGPGGSGAGGGGGSGMGGGMGGGVGMVV